MYDYSYLNDDSLQCVEVREGGGGEGGRGCMKRDYRSAYL